MNNPTSLPTKPRFYDLCLMYHVDEQALQDIATISGVEKSALDAMLMGVPVTRAEAEIVLAVLSQRTGHTWLFDNVHIPLVPITEECRKGVVEHLLAAIRVEYGAVCKGMYCLEQGKSNQPCISTHLEHLGELQEQLEKLVGDQAIKLIIERQESLDGPTDEKLGEHEAQ